MAALPLSQLDGGNAAPVYWVSLTFGHRTVTGTPLPPGALEVATALAQDQLTSLCGGSCTEHRSGTYRHDDGRQIRESNTTVWAFGFGSDIPLAPVTKLAAELAEALDQETVMLAVQHFPGQVFFIGPAAEQPLEEVELVGVA